MLILKIIVPLIFYDIAVFAAGIILPSHISPLAVTGAGALASLPFLYGFYRAEQKKRGRLMEADQTLLYSSIFIMLSAAASCIAFNYLISRSPLPALFPAYEAQFEDALTSPPLWEQILCTVIAIPAAEELCFRGHIYAPLRDKTGFWVSALFSSAIFGLYHGNMVQGVYSFCLGLLMAWIYERFRSIWASYLFHLTANLTAVMVSQFAGLDPFAGKPALALTAVCLISLPFCMYGIQKTARSH
ncbi:CPBP family intramembrane metalloprotease [Clostridium sp. MCC353]|uniref:CPBP family intramembrane glutamic endopeptidase n=1 Tax=Clostridium sp. MCC353 TaxID=2592646 RepID=UPI001C02D9DD|nr:type II CAAX endopeptidase family protein [Clostridium sp. MCC353]MBT9779934.1 CPBP family intramembrane metalloprotease [Clostridium sp. MCC353]